MTARVVRVLVALISSIGIAAAAAPSASAATPGIRRPTLTVVCSSAHNGSQFAAVRYLQKGSWAAGEQVVVTITVGRSERVKATLTTTTGPAGGFSIDRTLLRKRTGLWTAGATYTWTTAIYGASSAAARRGSVVATGTC
jgi:hypothetical protein